MRRRLNTLTGILLVALIGTLAFTSPANASTAAEAYTDFSNLAVQELDYANNVIASNPVATAGSTNTGNPDLGIPAIAYSYQTLVEAWKDGWDFQNATVKADMNRVLGLYTNSDKYGHAGFETGQSNYGDTILTVTQADHVGPLMLKAAKYDPTEYGPWLNDLVDTVMAAPVFNITNPNTGVQMPCISYYTYKNYCAVNVDAGAADFLKKAKALGYTGLGYTATQVQNRIDSAKAVVQYAYALGTPYWFPYSLNTDGTIHQLHNACGVLEPRTPEDWNHEAYVMDSITDLGWGNLGVNGRSAAFVLHHHLEHPAYNVQSFNGYPCRSDMDGARDIKGRLRMEYLDPSSAYDPQNTYTDVNWLINTWGSKRDDSGTLWMTASSAMQVSLFSMRLTEGVGPAAESINDFGVNSINQPQERCVTNGTNCEGDLAQPGATVTIDSFVKNPKHVGIVDKNVSLHLQKGTLLASKTTGLRGNIAFNYTMPNKSGVTRCLDIQSGNGTTSSSLCIKTK